MLLNLCSWHAEEEELQMFLCQCCLSQHILEQEVEFLGRCIRWTRDGLEYEAGAKHVQALVSDWDMQNCRSVSTPSTGPEKGQGEMSQPPLSEAQVAKYRRGAALCNYLAQDRCDIGYATKEVARSMASPLPEDEIRLKRLIRYLRYRPRGVYKFAWQSPTDAITCFVDSD